MTVAQAEKTQQEVEILSDEKSKEFLSHSLAKPNLQIISHAIIPGKYYRVNFWQQDGIYCKTIKHSMFVEINYNTGSAEIVDHTNKKKIESC